MYDLQILQKKYPFNIFRLLSFVTMVINNFSRSFKGALEKLRTTNAQVTLLNSNNKTALD